MKILAVILARKNSKRLKFKNKKKLGKYPLFLWSVFSALKIKNIQDILVSTDDEDIEKICNSKKICVVGLICDVERLSDVRRNRIQSMHENRPVDYTNEKKILNELENSKKLFKKHNWPTIDVTRKSVEETAASIIKILDILNFK